MVSRSIEEPILKYQDPKKPYTPFTDASKYAWSYVLTQSYEHEIDEERIYVQHPITYQSSLFRGN